MKCLNCGLVFLEPNQEDLKEFYEKEYRKLYSPTLGRPLAAKELFDVYLPFQEERVDKIRPFLNKESRVLDIGSSTGHFLFSIKKYVKECIGVELNQEHAQFANDQLGIKTFGQPLEETNLAKGHFDLISCLQVLEHIAQPLPFLKTLSQYLKPDGILYLEVPNLNDSLLAVFDIPCFRDFYFREPHLFYYSKNTLALLLKKSGFNGDIKGADFPNFIDQLHWILGLGPRANANLAYGEIVLPFLEAIDQKTKTEILNIFKKFDKEYRQFLADNFLGSSLVFIGSQEKQI